MIILNGSELFVQVRKVSEVKISSKSADLKASPSADGSADSLLCIHAVFLIPRIPIQDQILDHVSQIGRAHV